MSIREKLNQYKGVTLGAASAVILLALVMVVMQSREAGGEAEQAVAPSRHFFTVDDGKTWFPDDASKIPPFVKDGKEAVRAYVYRTSDGKEFVGLLERYSPAGKKLMEAAATPSTSGLPAAEDPLIAAAEQVQIKKPGQPAWVSVTDPRAGTISSVSSPKGPGDTIQPVTPGSAK